MEFQKAFQARMKKFGNEINDENRDKFTEGSLKENYPAAGNQIRTEKQN